MRQRRAHPHKRCQLMQVEIMMELDNHHLVNILPIIEVDKNHQMLKLRDEILMANRMFT